VTAVTIVKAASPADSLFSPSNIDRKRKESS